MTPGIHLAAGLALTLTAFTPLAAFAITPDFVGENEAPTVESPNTPNPVVENPQEQELILRSEDVFDNKRDQPSEQKPQKPQKTVVTVPRGQPSKVYPVPSKANFCPKGLQPVSISGVISCGSPNQAMTYPQMLSHPKPVRVKRKSTVTYHRSARPSCAPGEKGCSSR